MLTIGAVADIEVQEAVDRHMPLVTGGRITDAI
jgi:hypothetical protein